MTQHQIDEMILAMAKSDAEFDGYAWQGLSRVRQARYLERSRKAFKAAVGSASATIQAARLKAMADLADAQSAYIGATDHPTA